MSKWKMVKLGEVFERQITGEWGTECGVDDIGIKVLRTTNFTNLGIVDYTDVVIRKIDENKVSSKRLQHGDIILEKSGGSDTQPVGRVVYFDKSNDLYLCNNFTQALRTHNEIAYAKYVFYFMFYQHKIGATTLMQNKTTGIRNLQLKSYMNKTIPLPALEEQKRIAGILDKASNLIDLRKQQLEKMDLLIKSKFVDMFGDPVTNPKGWEVRKLIEVCKEIVDCPHSTPKHKDTPTNFPSIRTTELKNGVINWASMKYVNAEEYHSRTKRLVPQVNDIIYGREGSYGEAVLLPDGYSFCLGQRVMLLRSNENICCPIFLWYLIRSPLVYNQAKAKNIGATVGHVNVKDIMQFLIFLPPICIQNQFAGFVEKVEKQKVFMQQSLETMEINYKALMQEYFE